MAFKLIIICALILATTNANFVWTNTFQPFKMPDMPKIPFPKIEFPKIPTVEEIMNQAKTDPNANYNTVVVKSSSSSSTDDKGNVIKKGGTSVFSDVNGEQHTVQFGNDPPVLNKNSSAQTPNIEIPEITIPQIPIPQIVVPTIEVPQVVVPQNPFDLFHNMGTFQAVNSNNGFGGFQSMFTSSNGGGGFQTVFSSTNGGGGFASSSSSSSGHTTTVNGVTTGGGIASTHYSVNGDSGGNTIIYST